MAKEFASAFYGSPAWKECRDGYLRSVGGLCEVCYAKGKIVPAEIVHHKIHLTPRTINDPTISLSWDNLQAVCRECHAAEHGARQRRWRVDETGKVTAR